VKGAALTRSTPRDQLPLRIPALYWIDLAGYDPVAAAAQLDVPILVLHARNDTQIGAVDRARWRAELAGIPTATVHEYSGLNHLFIPEAAPGSQDMEPRGLNVSRDVVTDIAAWVCSINAARGRTSQ